MHPMGMCQVVFFSIKLNESLWHAHVRLGEIIYKSNIVYLFFFSRQPYILAAGADRDMPLSSNFSHGQPCRDTCPGPKTSEISLEKTDGTYTVTHWTIGCATVTFKNFNICKLRCQFSQMQWEPSDLGHHSF